MSRIIQPSDLVMAKELTDFFEQQQVTIDYAYARALIVACPSNIRGRYIKAQDAWTWWVLHADFKPFSKKPAPPQRVLAENTPPPFQSS